MEDLFKKAVLVLMLIAIVVSIVIGYLSWKEVLFIIVIAVISGYITEILLRDFNIKNK